MCFPTIIKAIVAKRLRRLPTMACYDNRFHGSFLLFHLQIYIHRQMVAKSVGGTITFE